MRRAITKMPSSEGRGALPPEPPAKPIQRNSKTPKNPAQNQKNVLRNPRITPNYNPADIAPLHPRERSENERARQPDPARID